MCCYTKRVALVAGILTARHVAFFQLLYQSTPIFCVLFENIVHSIQCYQLQKRVPHKAYKGTLLVLSRPPTDRATATTQTWEFNQLYAIHYGSELPFYLYSTKTMPNNTNNIKINRKITCVYYHYPPIPLLVPLPLPPVIPPCPFLGFRGCLFGRTVACKKFNQNF